MSSRLKPMSARAVEGLKATAFVGGAPGLQLLVSAKGTRSWRLFYRLPGSTTRRAMKLGRYPDVSLADARRLAIQKLTLAGEASDPRAERINRARDQQRTIASALAAYFEACASINDARTVRDKRSALTNNLLRPFGDAPLVALDRAMTLQILDSLGDRPALRRNVFTYLKHFLSWCADRDLLQDNPIASVRPPKSVRSRDRVLTDPEIRQLWKVQSTFANICRVSLLTAQRKGSVEAMKWDHLDAGQRVWTIPADDMKSGRLHEVPLSEMAHGILGGWPRMAGPYVFGVGSNGSHPYAGASNGMDGLRARLREDHGYEPETPWRLHDLRRTAVTLAQRGGASIEEIRALTQHKTPGVIGIYARHAYSVEKRLVADIIAAEVHAILNRRSAV